MARKSGGDYRPGRRVNAAPPATRSWNSADAWAGAGRKCFTCRETRSILPEPKINNLEENTQK